MLSTTDVDRRWQKTDSRLHPVFRAELWMQLTQGDRRRVCAHSPSGSIHEIKGKRSRAKGDEGGLKAATQPVTAFSFARRRACCHDKRAPTCLQCVTAVTEAVQTWRSEHPTCSSESAELYLKRQKMLFSQHHGHQTVSLLRHVLWQSSPNTHIHTDTHTPPRFICSAAYVQFNVCLLTGKKRITSQ